jgi:hypothetical protein
MKAVITSGKCFHFTLKAANTNAESDLGEGQGAVGVEVGIVQGCAGRQGSVESTASAIISAAMMYTHPTTIGILVAGLFNLVIGTSRFPCLVDAFASSAVAAVISTPTKAKAATRNDILMLISLCNITLSICLQECEHLVLSR